MRYNIYKLSGIKFFNHLVNNSLPTHSINDKPFMTKSLYHRAKGFTLVEIIVGIVVLAISFSLFTAILFPLAEDGAEQVHQIKAAELGQSLLNEITTKAYDENSDMDNGIMRCGDNGYNPCSTSLGSDSENRNQYDDVDDYHGLHVLANSLGQTAAIQENYLGYRVSVAVIWDSNYDGVSTGIDNNYTAKLITVTVTTPQNFDFVFSSYRVNF